MPWRGLLALAAGPGVLGALSAGWLHQEALTAGGPGARAAAAAAKTWQVMAAAGAAVVGVTLWAAWGFGGRR